MAEPALVSSVFDRLLKDRIIWLGSEVRDENANEIAAKLLLLAAEDPKRDISLYINSPGGSVTAGMAIYDTMQFVPNDIVTVGIGMAASMGQLLLTAGTKGKRFITPNARVLLHQPHGGFGGTSSDIQTQAQLILDMKRRLAEITASQTGKTVEQVNEDGDRDRWFNAQEALEYGFVDHIRETAIDVAEVTAGGTKGKRLALPNARILIHQPAIQGQGGGQASDIEIQAMEVLRMRDWLEETLAHHSNRTREQVNKDIERDKILGAAEAVEYGLIDQVLTSRKTLPALTAK